MMFYKIGCSQLPPKRCVMECFLYIEMIKKKKCNNFKAKFVVRMGLSWCFAKFQEN